MDAQEIEGILSKYDEKKISIATIGSHSALNIFKGAREEGLRTACICMPGRDHVYRYYDLVDDFIYVDSYAEILNPKIQESLLKLNSIVIPHGSFNAYINQDQMERDFRVPIFGNRQLLRWEVSRSKQHFWLKKAGLHVPKVYDSINDVDGALAFIKFEGAKGGKGYFVADSPKTYKRKLKDMVKRKLITKEESQNPYIQEYITGVSVYPHYFHSPLTGRTELVGFDKRYESSVDGIYRIPVPEQLEKKINPSFSVVGNFPMVVRESMLNPVIGMGKSIADAAAELAAPGAIGPFCLETIVTDNLDVVAFEISARIVAGCNVNIGWNPYTYLEYDEPMYMGKRIAREVTEARRQKKLTRVIT